MSCYYLPAQGYSFTTPLEMPPPQLHGTPLQKTSQNFQYSIGDAFAAQVLSQFGAAWAFQYSIGDAHMDEFVGWVNMRLLSILHWRCAKYDVSSY